MTVGEPAPEERQELGEQFRIVLVSAPDGVSCDRVCPGRPAQAEVDPTGAQLLEHTELLDDRKRRVIGEHDAHRSRRAASWFGQPRARPGNYYPSWRDGHIEAIERGTTESGWVSSMLGRPVVKVFNNITAQSLAEGARPKGSRVRIALPVAGNDARAKIGAEHRVRTGDLRPWQGEALCPHGRSVSLLIHAMTAARSAACSGMPSNLARLSRCFHTFTGNRTERGIVGPVSVPFLGLPRPT